MTDCRNAEIRDALPDLIHGKLGEVDAATVLAHVDSCDACAAELALLREVLGSAALAPSVDVAKIVSALPLRISAPASAARSSFGRMAWPGLGIAAAAAILVTGAVILRSDDVQVADSRIAQPVAPSAAPEAGKPGVGVSPSETPAQQQPAPASDRSSLSLVAGVQELTDAELESLIAELDGIDGVPSEEPLLLAPVADFEGES